MGRTGASQAREPLGRATAVCCRTCVAAQPSSHKLDVHLAAAHLHRVHWQVHGLCLVLQPVWDGLVVGGVDGVGVVGGGKARPSPLCEWGGPPEGRAGGARAS